jgi:hypothetical protein
MGRLVRPPHSYWYWHWYLVPETESSTELIPKHFLWRWCWARSIHPPPILIIYLLKYHINIILLSSSWFSRLMFSLTFPHKNLRICTPIRPVCAANRNHINFTTATTLDDLYKPKSTKFLFPECLRSRVNKTVFEACKFVKPELVQLQLKACIPQQPLLAEQTNRRLRCVMWRSFSI